MVMRLLPACRGSSCCRSLLEDEMITTKGMFVFMIYLAIILYEASHDKWALMGVPLVYSTAKQRRKVNDP